MNKLSLLFLITGITLPFNTPAQTYPPDKQLVFDAMPVVPKPGYLSPITDPTFKTTVVRIGDQAVFDTKYAGLKTRHHYAKDQAWNSDGSLICLEGWPSAILDGKTFTFVKYINPPGGPHTWSNTLPNIIYGTNNSNTIVKVDVTTNTKTTVKTFGEYTSVSMGDWEGNMSNDDRYMALQCKNGTAVYIVCYDMVNNQIVSSMSAPENPNNCCMSQSGKYVVVQWMTDGLGEKQGICVYNRSDMGFVRNVSTSTFVNDGNHFDCGIDIQGRDVLVTNGNNRSIGMLRLDDGTGATLLSDAQGSYPFHVSCRNLNRPGWAYLTEFQSATGGTRTTAANYQKIYALRLDPAATGNALTETFAHVHHSTNTDYENSPFGTSNRDGSKVIFRSDWGDASGEIDSYVAFMPSSTGTHRSGLKEGQGTMIRSVKATGKMTTLAGAVIQGKNADITPLSTFRRSGDSHTKGVDGNRVVIMF